MICLNTVLNFLAHQSYNIRFQVYFLFFRADLEVCITFKCRLNCTKESLVKQFGKVFNTMNGMARELKRSKESTTGKTKTQEWEFINLDVLICLLTPYIWSPFVLLFDDQKLLNSFKLCFRWVCGKSFSVNMSLVVIWFANLWKSW